MGFRGTSLFLFSSLFFFLLSCSNNTEAPTDSASNQAGRRITNGNESKVPGVGAIIDSADPNNVCSAVEVGSRCILTSAHCNLAQTGYAGGRYYTQALSIYPKPVLGVPVLRTLNSPYWLGKGPSTGDLTLVYLYPKYQTVGKLGAVGPLASWSPYGIGPAKVGEVVQAVGYGYDQTDGKGLYGGLGTQRSGTLKITEMHNATSSTGEPAGAYFTLVSAGTGADFQTICQGDSGGAVLFGKTLVGINMSTDTGCLAKGYGLSFTNGTDTWLSNNIKSFCVPLNGLHLDVLPSGSQGYVGGALATTRAAAINCGTDYKHTLCSLSPQPSDINLTAYPATGGSFVKWTDAPEMPGSCPCNGSASRTCNITSTNNLPSNTWGETANCVAYFIDPSPHPTASPTVTPTTTPVTTPTTSPRPR